MKKLIACLLTAAMLLGSMVLAIGAADDSEPARVPPEHGPVTQADVDKGIVSE